MERHRNQLSSRLKRIIRFLAPLCASLTLLNCSSIQDNANKPILERTIVDGLSFDGEFELPHKLIAPSHLIPEYEVVRKYAELRKGPGTHFPLVDQHLKKSDRVILLYRYKFWMKVADPSKGKLGWVHRQTIKWVKNESPLISIDQKALENVFVSEKSAKLYDYMSKNTLPIKAPKGAPLKVLHSDGDHLLIYLPKTHSIAWIKKVSVR